MFGTVALNCFYGDDRQRQPRPDSLAVVGFGDGAAVLRMEHEVPFVSVPTCGNGTDRFYENWTAVERRGSGCRDGLVYAYSDEYLFCAGQIVSSGSYAEKTHGAYRATFKLADELGFPEPLRMWNYIASINATNDDGLEVYRDFCKGRANAFDEFKKRIPAATGVGATSGGIMFYLLSRRSGSPVHVENPRQVPAYDYPRRYGPRSPAFARATIDVNKDGATRGTVYVSGTASIVGHETVCAGLIERQTDVALDNIAQLIGEPNLRRHGVDFGLSLTDIRSAKVYVRYPEHLDAVRDRCGEAFAAEADIRYLTVDICRSDLLVEIEAIA